MNEVSITEGLTLDQTKSMILYVANRLITNEEFLCDIDRKIGDGDHGTGMANGAKAVIVDLTASQCIDVSAVFKKAGLAMMESMGGASGIIFSSIFLGIGKAAMKTERLSTTVLSLGVKNAIDTIKKRGKASLGDKTMLDALIPASEVLEKNTDNNLIEALSEATSAAYQGVEKTKDYPAKFGRAKFLGDRSLGHQDAGATTVAIIFESMENYLKENV
ncbi:dihydroxyacetone kinase subunit DhaL [Candidatus Enterococcus murrayae]|uniref:Dihydroxyacetone kinase subunit L n=1 Tax=Candidatus Enterococcus murrayae TaxID=2815321 RepID=A0ABS3HLM6_9ENTE|nr:dihydroxyacetone kinase subunit DhaL [Enterococcus sp. MJM16]MBO0454223.1 dihydroxyacetone kinase subunit L [Enterococcus sp. MJM16]